MMGAGVNKRRSQEMWLLHGSQYVHSVGRMPPGTGAAIPGDAAGHVGCNVTPY